MQPAEMQYAKGYAEVRATEDDECTITATISDATVDRMGDVIDQSGWILDNYKKNPVVLWCHDYSIPPIGKATDIRVVNGKLKATTKFAKTELAQEVWNLYRGGFLSSFSVGFKPRSYRPIKDEEGNVTGFRFVEQELLEYSAVSVPANPNANATMRAMVQRGLISGVVKYLPSSVTGATADEIAEWAEKKSEMLDAVTRYENIKRLLAL